MRNRGCSWLAKIVLLRMWEVCSLVQCFLRGGRFQGCGKKPVVRAEAGTWEEASDAPLS